MRMLWVICCLLSSVTFAQKKSVDTVLHTFNEELIAASAEQSIFAGYAIRTGSSWSAMIYDAQQKLVARGSYASKQCKGKEGWFTFYYLSGQRAANGQFARDHRQGNWRTWYENGQLRDSINYEKDKPHGVYYTYFENGRISGFGAYKQGFEEGSWTWYHPNGQVSSVEEYIDGRLKGQQCFDINGRKQLSQCKLFAEPVTAQHLNIRQLIRNHAPLPKDASGRLIEGYVTANIHLTEKGELKSFTVLSADHPALDSLARKTLATQQWLPAYNHNRAVAFNRTIQIPFFKDFPSDHAFLDVDQGTPGNDGRMPALSTGKSAKFRDKYGLGSY